MGRCVRTKRKMGRCGESEMIVEEHCGANGMTTEAHCEVSETTTGVHCGESEMVIEVHCGASETTTGVRCGASETTTEVHYGESETTAEVHCVASERTAEARCSVRVSHPAPRRCPACYAWVQPPPLPPKRIPPARNKLLVKYDIQVDLFFVSGSAQYHLLH